MELLPALTLGWRNGWLLWAVLVLIEGLMLLTSPREVRARLFDRSGWNQQQVRFTVLGKLVSLICLALLTLTPLKCGTGIFYAGLVVYAVGLVALVLAIRDFRNTPVGQPVTRGLYRISRHPQLVALFVAFCGICLAVGSWPALLALLISRVLEHWGILGEEQVCLAQYGDSYRQYMQRVPRYFLFF